MTDKHAAELSADRPSTDPAQDLFGHAPFARTLARAIRGYRGSDGIVLALYGPWGSGKSTVLAYVEHELEQGPAAEQPVVVSFNPWWFSGQEHLARAFLGQLQAVLPAKHAGFKALGNKLSEFGGALGGVADLAGAAFGIPLGGKVIEAGAKLLATKPKDVPALKKAVSALLLEEKKRVLVVIDDIDRLAPDEVRQLFTVIKALADFPYITYLLAFDREVAATAISEQTGLPGDRYLEKIIQVPFELPRVDKTTLRQALFTKLDAVMAGTPHGRFDGGHWTNVFHSGLDPLFTVPRDIVRLTNALSVTYPAVVGEVNPVDFIAIECLRVFLPAVYDAVRTSSDEFTGYKAAGDHVEKQRAVAFHDAWLGRIPEGLRGSTKELMQLLFPRLESVWSNMHYSGDSLQQWRRQLRVCVPDVFSAYFRLSLPDGAVSRAELDSVLQLAMDPLAFAGALRKAAKHKSPTGISMARGLLERFMDHVTDELDVGHAQPVISVLLDMGDELLVATDRIRGDFDFGNESRVTRIAYHLLKKVEPSQRAPLLTYAMERGQAPRCGQYLFGALVEEVEKAAKGDGQSLVSAADAGHLKNVWCQRVRLLSQQAQFIDHPGLARLLHGWRHWGGDEEAKAWWAQASSTDEGLLKLIAAFASESTSQTFGEYAVRIRLRVNPKGLAFYGDVNAMTARVNDLLDAGKVPEAAVPAARQFVLECARMKEGKDPDGFGFDDD
jgi:predicted KAP-like P-loop ATPase